MNTAYLIDEAMELARASGQEAISKKLQEILEAFQVFEKRYNEDRLQEQDFEALKKICSGGVQKPAFYKAPFAWDARAKQAAAILWRHGVHAMVNEDTGQVVFEKVA